MGRLGVVGHVFETNRGDWGEEGHRGAHVAFTLGRVALSASCRVPLTVCMAGRMNRPDKTCTGRTLNPETTVRMSNLKPTPCAMVTSQMQCVTDSTH